MNTPSKIGARYLCFVVLKRGRGWSGPYGQSWSGPVWECVECHFRIAEHYSGFNYIRAARHHEHGHAPCTRCGKSLLLRKDGTPRQHAHNLCAGKTPGHKIEREFVKNMTEREMA